MALGTPVDGGAAYSASGGSTVSPAYPAGIVAGDCLVLIVGQKPASANGGLIIEPDASWTVRESLQGAGGYGTTLGADTGNTNLAIFTKTAVGDETGTLSVPLSVNGVSWALIVRIPTDGGTLSYGAADGSRTTAPTAGTAFSVALTNGASATSFAAGDMALWAMCIPTDATTPSQFTAQSITATGATFLGATELEEPDSATGSDIGGYVAYASCIVGNGTAGAPTVTVTAAGTVTNVRGPIAVLRIREAASAPQTLTPSLFTETIDYFSPTVSAENDLSPSLFTNDQTFYAPTVIGPPQTLTAARFDNTTTFYAASVSQPLVLAQRVPYANIPGDEYFESVVALLLFNSTIGADSSFSYRTWTGGGTNSISSVQSITGGASAYLNNGSIYAGSSADFNLNDGDFTIDGWYYEEATSSGSIVSRRSPATSGFALTTSALRAVVNGSWSDSQITWTRPSFNEWHHFAYVRSGSNLYIFIDGALVGSRSSVTTLGDEATTVYIGLGSTSGENPFRGYLDNFRWTKGVARWTSNFVPPTTERALLPGAQSTAYDLNFDDVRLLLLGEGSNGSQVFRDRSNRPSQVTVSNNAQVSHVRSKFGNASIYFDGDNDHLRVAGGTLPFGTSDFTVDFWYYTSTTNRVSTFLRGDDGGTTGVGLEILHDGTNLRLALDGGTTTLVSTPVSGIPLDDWNHFSFVRSGSSWYIFINGVQAGATGTSSASVALPQNYRVGGSLTSSYSALGYIDDFRVTIGTARNTGTYAVPIQETSAASRFPPAKVGARQELTQATRFDNYAAYDDSYNSVSTLLLGNGTNGSTTFVESGPTAKTWTAAGNAQISTVQSRFGGASLSFDGNGDYIRTANSADFNFGSGNFTIESFVRLNAYPAAWATIGSNLRDSPTKGWRLLLDPAGRPVFSCYFSSGSLTNSGAQAGTTGIALNTWTHVAAVRDGVNIRYYVGGTLTYTHVLAAGTTVAASDVQFDIGMEQAFTWPFNGYLDDYRITKGVARYNANFTPPTSQLPTSSQFRTATLAQGAGGVVLTQATRFDNTNTFYAATVARGPVTLTPALFQDVEVFYAATVARGPVTLTPARFDNTNVFYSPTVLQAQTLTPARFDNTNTFYAATVSATRTLTASLYTNTNTFYAHAASALNLLTAARYDNTNVFYNATVSALRTLTPALYTNAQTFYAATVARGPVTLTPALFTNAQTFYAATVSLQGAPQTLTPALFTNANAFYSATLTASYALTAARFDNAHAFYSATVAASNTLAPALFTNANTFYAATLAGGASLLLPALYTNANTFYAATVARGAITLTPARFNNANTFYGATVTSFRSLTVDRFDNVTTFFVATLVRGPVGLQPARYNNVNAFYAPAVNQLTGIFPNRYDDADTFYAASIQVLTPTLFPQRFNNTNVFPFHYLAGGVQFVTQGEFDVFDFGSEVAVLGRTPTLASKSLTPSSTILTTSNPVFTRLTKTDQTVKGGPRPAIFVK